ncbi:MAG: RagB/SusD family nutrient uptake outer membrane protein [Prolixibacteraceae bacterium]|jgi:hypothetical protein|nr:RagB/SusD family nutrient uptake outer membrane protein [Prolixibacteraceae bacterium]
MNKIKNIIYTMLATVVVAGFTSCGDEFLTEEYTTAYSTEHFETEEGLNNLAVALYANIRYHFAYEWAYGTTNYGTDEFSMGTDFTSEMWNTYDSRLAPYVTNSANKNFPSPEHLWNQMYYGINSANIIIQNQDVFIDQDLKDKCLGEAYYLRGYNYLRLVSQYGGVVLQLKPADGVVRNFTRSSAEECVASIVSDLEKAYELLPENEWRGEGTWTKPAAAHFLAKTLLFRVSERNDNWNASYKDADLNRIITLADYVIAERPLAGTYQSVFAEWDGIDCAAEANSEILMAAQFNQNATGGANGRFGNRTYCYFPAQYSNMGYMTRKGAVSLDFQRCRPTEYGVNVFDVENDSRFWKSFKTMYNVNKASADNEYGIENGDLSIIYIVNSKDDDRFDVDGFGPSSFSYVDERGSGKVVPHAFITYDKDGNWVQQNWGNNRYLTLSKYEDGTIIPKSTQSARDGVLARTAETYLIKSEALVRQGNYQQAIDVINVLRRRAEWAGGEDRSFYQDGCQAAADSDDPASGYSSRNSYYESTNIEETTAASELEIGSYTNLPEVDENIFEALNVSGEFERMLHFILNERSRELYGEFLRWEDLSRTKTLVMRSKAFNAEAAGNIDEHHELRPIPQSFIDGLLNENGTNLSQEELEEMQNPGY